MTGSPLSRPTHRPSSPIMNLAGYAATPQAIVAMLEAAVTYMQARAAQLPCSPSEDAEDAG